MNDIKKFAHEIFNLSEDTIYTIINKFNNNQNVDKSLTYVYIKAFYLHNIKRDLENKNKLENFDKIYSEYKSEISKYYKTNNSGISEELINDILEAFDKSFEIIESIGFKDLDESYEFRHYIVIVFELLRKILEKKSKEEIRVDIFESSISSLKDTAEKIIDYSREQN